MDLELNFLSRHTSSSRPDTAPLGVRAPAKESTVVNFVKDPVDLSFVRRLEPGDST